MKTVVPKDVEVAMFADDVSLFCSHNCKLTAQTAMQEAVTRVAEWSRHHKMTLNTQKCDLAFFTSNQHEARWQPKIHLEGQPLRFTPLPELSTAHSPFGQHIANITAKAAGRRCALTSPTSKQWGWRKGKLTKIYKALHLSVLMYGTPAWQSWLAATPLDQ